MNRNPDAMTLDAFDDALLRYGSDVTRWPDDKRRRAEQLLAADAGARDLLAAEQAMTATAAAALDVPMAPAQVAARVATAVAARRERSFTRWLLNPFPIAAGAAAAIALGVAVALLTPISAGVDSDALLVAVLGGGLI
jgi:hypothetical protein